MKRVFFLPKPEPVRSTMLPWNPREVLPAEFVRRPKPVIAPISPIIQPEMFVLVDVLAEDIPLSKGKARKAIRKGQVRVNEVVVYDPDLRVSTNDVIEYQS